MSISDRLVVGGKITAALRHEVMELVKSQRRLLDLVEDLSASAAEKDVRESDPEPAWSDE